jgi:hypothetical protein
METSQVPKITPSPAKGLGAFEPQARKLGILAPFSTRGPWR